jgi:starch synthase
MKKDGFEYKFNVEVWMLQEKVIVGVHEGVVNGVKMYFLHNVQYFHHAYAGEDAHYVMRQLTVYAKATLELFCQLKFFPATVVTNDWFCALIPAYIKLKRYGDAFNNTKCFHIAHNLDPKYEGRLYPKPAEGVK